MKCQFQSNRPVNAKHSKQSDLLFFVLLYMSPLFVLRYVGIHIICTFLFLFFTLFESVNNDSTIHGGANFSFQVAKVQCRRGPRCSLIVCTQYIVMMFCRRRRSQSGAVRPVQGGAGLRLPSVLPVSYTHLFCSICYAFLLYRSDYSYIGYLICLQKIDTRITIEVAPKVLNIYVSIK